jgi:glutamine amidotransferase
MQIIIIDYGSGNLRSAAKAFGHVAGDNRVSVSSDPEILKQASHVVLPGVGAFGDCVAGLNAVDGMREALEEAVIAQEKPFFGICVGMQMMAEMGLEHGEHQGLGWVKGQVVPLSPTDAHLKIPHMGWNSLRQVKPHPILDGIDEEAHVYFVHGYHMQPAEEVTIATTEYGQAVTAMIAKDNRVGTQFHPEKSQTVGLQLIANFLKL